MARQFARFVAAPIGPGLVAADSGLTLTTTLAGLDIQRTARSDVAHALGEHGAEFTFWGNSTLVAAIGLVQAGASLSAAVGIVAGSVGWRLDAGTIARNGVQQTSGLAIPVKGDIVSVRLRGGEVTSYADFYRGTALLFTVAIGAGEWYFAVSMASPNAAELFCAVNAGQWPALTAAGRAGWQPSPASTPILRISDVHFLTASTDTPSNTRYEGFMAPAGIDLLSEVGFWPWSDSTSPRGGSAQFSCYAPDGYFDAIEGDEVAVAIRTVDTTGTLASAAQLGRFMLDAIEVEADARVRVRLRDAHDDLDEPVNPGVFLPSIPQLAWQPQPLVIGAVASVPLMLANNDGTVGFLADAPVAAVDTVLDRGDALEAGTWSLTSGNQLLLESPPLGPVVADVSTIGAGMTPASLQQALHQVFSRVRKASWSSADAASIDTATGYAGIGYYVGGSVQSARQARDAMLASYGAAAYQAADGTVRFVRLVDPDTAVASLELDQALLDADLVVTPDFAPNLTRRMAYRPNAAPMEPGEFVTDLVDVPVQRRQELMGLYRGMVYSARPLASRYSAAERRGPFISLFWRAQDAQAEIDRICGLYAVERNFYRWSIAGQPSLSLVPGQIVRVSYPRYGLSAGRNLLVAGIQRNPVTGRVTLRLWGA
jgi:hypothetical protein